MKPVTMPGLIQPLEEGRPSIYEVKPIEKTMVPTFDQSNNEPLRALHLMSLVAMETVFMVDIGRGRHGNRSDTAGFLMKMTISLLSRSHPF